MSNEEESMDDTDLLDEAIVPDPKDPGDLFVLPDLIGFTDEDTPVDEDAHESPDIEGIDGEDDDA